MIGHNNAVSLGKKFPRNNFSARENSDSQVFVYQKQGGIIYNLYHVLNHYNLFGAGYLGQARRMIEKLLAALR